MSNNPAIVDPGGSGDYTSLNNWVTGEKDGGSSGANHPALCRRTTSAKDTTPCTISGTWSTAAPVSSVDPAYRHQGYVADQRTDTGAYIYTIQLVSGNALSFSAPGKIDGVQLIITGASSGFLVGTGAVTSGTIVISNCVLKGGSGSQSGISDSNAGSGGATVVSLNNVITGCTARGIYGTAGTWNVINTTIANCGTGVQRYAGTVNVKNCYVNATTEYTGTITRTTCAHASATSYSGSTASIAYSTANFTNVTAGSENLHVVQGGPLDTLMLGGSTDLTTDFATYGFSPPINIGGQTRPSSASFGIGAAGYAAVSGFKPFWIPRRSSFIGGLQ